MSTTGNEAMRYVGGGLDLFSLAISREIVFIEKNIAIIW